MPKYGLFSTTIGFKMQRKFFKCQKEAYKTPIFWHFKCQNWQLKHHKWRLCFMKWTPALLFCEDWEGLFNSCLPFNNIVTNSMSGRKT